jgi:hypothetical protein
LSRKSGIEGRPYVVNGSQEKRWELKYVMLISKRAGQTLDEITPKLK